MRKPDYSNSILNVSATFLNHYNVPTKYSTINILQEELKKGYNHIIYILLDGMGVSTIKAHLTKEDALYKYLKKEITSVYPPTTVAATTSVLSGLPPISSGYLGWVQYFKREDTDLVIFLNTDFYTNRYQKENLASKYLHYTTILEQINTVNPMINCSSYLPSFIEGGSKSFEEEIEKVLITTHNTDQSFNYVYWTDPDSTTHVHGTKSSELHQVMKGLNHDFEELIDNITDDTLVVVVADHGLIDITEIPFYQYKDLNNMLVRKPSIEPRTANFFVKESELNNFKMLFNSTFSESYHLYTKQEFLDTNLLGYGDKHPLIDEFLGDYIAVAISDKMFIFNNSKGYISHHAGLSEEEMMVPLIMYTKKQG